MGEYCESMDEGTLKTPIPKCRHYWSILFGVVGNNFVGFKSGQNKVLNSWRIWPTKQLNIPPHTATHCIYYTFTLGREGGGQREGRGATGQKYCSFVHGATVHKLGRKYQPTSECISILQSIKSVKHMLQSSLTGHFLRKADI